MSHAKLHFSVIGKVSNVHRRNIKIKGLEISLRQAIFIGNLLFFHSAADFLNWENNVLKIFA